MQYFQNFSLDDIKQNYVSFFIGLALSIILFTHKGFGSLMGVLVIASLISLRIGNLKKLATPDYIFLATLCLYPLMVITSLLINDIEDWGIFDNASRFILIGIVYLLLRSKLGNISFIITGAAVGSLITGIESAYFLLHNAGDRFGGFENPLVFAQIALLLAAIAVCPQTINFNNATANKLYVLACCLFVTTAIIASQVRGVFIFLPLLFVYVAFLDRRVYFTKIEIVLIAGILMAGFYALFTSPVFYHFEETVTEFVANLQSIDSTTSLGERLVLWIGGVELFAQKPVFGFGAGQFNLALNSLPLSSDMTADILSYSHAHNELLNLAVEFGLIGPIVLLTTFLLPPVIGLRLGFCRASIFILCAVSVTWLAFGITQTQLAHQKITLLQISLLATGFAWGMNRKYGLTTGENTDS